MRHRRAEGRQVPREGSGRKVPDVSRRLYTGDSVQSLSMEFEQSGNLENNQKEPLEIKICNMEIQNTTGMRIHKLR